MSARLCLCVVWFLSLAGVGCSGREAGTDAPPYYAERTFTPVWAPVSHSVTTQPVSDTPFVDQRGHAFTPASMRGRIHVVSFMFTQCGAVCPQLLSSLKKVQAGSRVALVSYSVDPGRDSVDVLRAFGVSRGIDPDRWALLTGTVDGVYRVARDLYFADDDGMRKSLADPETFLHTEKLLLVDRDGHLRGIYNGTQPFEIQKLLEDIRILDSGP